MEHYQNIPGGLIGQLRAHALKSSDDGEWNINIEQQSIDSRSVRFGGEGDMLEVLFDSRRIRRIGSGGLRTVYRMSAIQTETGLVLDLLPPHVAEVMTKTFIAVGDAEQEVATFRINDEEVDEYEFDSFDDIEYRHVRSLDYYIDGNGTVLSSTWQDFYDDDDGVEIFGVRSTKFGSSYDSEETKTLLDAWWSDTQVHDISGLMKHPELRDIEVKHGAKELRNDMLFLDIVGNYVNDKNLAKHSDEDRRKTILTMLAFVNYQASSKDIRKLL